MHAVKVVLSCLAVALIASDVHARPKVNEAAQEQTCGQELAAAAEVPQKWQELMNHVAGNMEWHATWVGTDSNAAKMEHDALVRIAGEYRAMAAAAARASTAMKAMVGLAPAPHDPSKVDRKAQARWMRAKIQMQRDFVLLLSRHADDSEKALAAMEAPAGR